MNISWWLDLKPLSISNTVQPPTASFNVTIKLNQHLKETEYYSPHDGIYYETAFFLLSVPNKLAAKFNFKWSLKVFGALVDKSENTNSKNNGAEVVVWCFCPLLASSPGVFFFVCFNPPPPHNKMQLEPPSVQLAAFWIVLTPPCLHSSHSDKPPPRSVPIYSQYSGLEAALSRDRGQLWGKGNRMVKMAVWGLSATLGAAVFAVAQTALDWGPDVLLQLFWCGGGDLDCETLTLTHGDSRHTSALRTD